MLTWAVSLAVSLAGIHNMRASPMSWRVLASFLGHPAERHLQFPSPRLLGYR